MNNCIVSVAFRVRYVEHSKRQEGVLLNDEYPKDLLFFRDELPMKNIIYTDDIVGEFQKSLYGFKPHAIQLAIDKGYKKIVWFDPSVLPVSSVKILFDTLDEHPLIFGYNDGLLDKMANKKAKNYFGVTEEECSKLYSTGGTIYGFNFNHPDAVKVFEMWKKAEEDGIFGTQDDFMAGHWADEACISLAAYKCGVERHWIPEFEYLNQKSL